MAWGVEESMGVTPSKTGAVVGAAYRISLGIVFIFPYPAKIKHRDHQ